MIVDKPWGHEIRWAINDKYLGKILHINRGAQLSRQYHEKKDETIFVLNGILILELGEDPVKQVILKPGDSHRIKPMTIHRFKAPSDNWVKLVEVSTPEIEDVVRIEDDYGRS